MKKITKTQNFVTPKAAEPDLQKTVAGSETKSTHEYLLTAFFCALIMSIGFGVAGMTDGRRVYLFFNLMNVGTSLWDPSLALVFASAFLSLWAAKTNSKAHNAVLIKWTLRVLIFFELVLLLGAALGIIIPLGLSWAEPSSYSSTCNGTLAPKIWVPMLGASLLCCLGHMVVTHRAFAHALELRWSAVRSTVVNTLLVKLVPSSNSSGSPPSPWVLAAALNLCLFHAILLVVGSVSLGFHLGRSSVAVALSAVLFIFVVGNVPSAIFMSIFSGGSVNWLLRRIYGLLMGGYVLFAGSVALAILLSPFSYAWVNVPGSSAMGTIALFVDSGVALYQLVWFFMSAPVPVASIEAEETLEKSLEETARTDQAAQ